MHLVLGVIFPLAPLFLLRGQAREKSGIEVDCMMMLITMMVMMMTIRMMTILNFEKGGAVGDFCTVLCCPGCAHLQQYKEVKSIINLPPYFASSILSSSSMEICIIIMRIIKIILFIMMTKIIIMIIFIMN